MARLRLTRKFVDGLHPPTKGQRFVWDSEIPGFGVRLTPSGTKAWVVQFRIRGGKERRMALGLCNRVPLELARQEARKVIAAADLGRDPATERRDAREVRSDTNPLFSEFAMRWLEEIASQRNRASTLKHRRLLLQNHILPIIGAKRISDLDRQTLENLHLRISQRHKVAANRAISLCSVILGTAARWGWIAANPASQIHRNAEHGRERYLTADELARLNIALDQSPSQDSADVIRLLILTGSRVAEVLGMRWQQIDFESAVWTKPAATTKQNKSHRVPLSPQTLEILERRRKLARRSEWVFPGQGRGGHMTTVRTFWTAVCRRAALKGVRIHDLRHTFASMLVSAGESLSVIGALLGHTQARTTGRYAHLMDNPLRSAATRVGNIVKAANG